ncbi:MAG TPA: cell wall hydrolase [Sphingomicrobium sp.]|nr:cell wall hydrolase [Sphingomicrobium sp.]
MLANVNRHEDWSRFRRLARSGPPPTNSSITIDLPNLIRPLTPQQAVQQNLERPFDAAPDTPAQKFQLKADDDSRGRALECLTQAIYYEAAAEGADGQRAVAQVVLNRMRHPGFPSSVCGVVYQGSELPTGCQFTFTCDGSLARTPLPAVWAQAKRIAGEALAGSVDAAVGHATHYHADYVVPYWADSLLKQVQIGHHIFYRLRGGLGSSAAFSQHYAGAEPNLAPPPSTVAVANEATDQAQQLLNSGLAGPPPVAADAVGPAGAQEPKQVLLADARQGVLLIDKGAAPVHKVAPKPRDDCARTGSKQIVPAAPNDVRAADNPHIVC